MDMFPGASALGDSVSALFSPDKVSEAQYSLTNINKMDRFNNMGVRSEAYNSNSDSAGRNSPTKTKPAPTEDPQEVEARWMARLAKFAGIASATGVKVGG